MKHVLFSVLKWGWRFLIGCLKLASLLLEQEVLMKYKPEAYLQAIVHQEVQARMSEFISVLSHDIKTPLTSIKGNIQLMRRRLNQDFGTVQEEELKKILEESRELLERTNQQMNRLTLLVNNQLESSHIHADTMELLFEVCEMNSLVRETAQDARFVPANRAIQVHIPEQTLLVMADVNRIKQTIVHYLSNAHRYSTLEGCIDVSLIEDGKHARVQVHDEGPGIPSHEQKRIWDLYYRVPGTRTLTGTEVGLGLGLHISRTIVERHHGKVGVLSTPGAGTTFWFTLPLIETRLNIPG
ncbi:MAG TPA: HAMP domain-containing sensor histidine kinase [Ktedonobacteraceae bacterium]|nr:HAMP domain-containing sensor histidine kinase [Ktedonobacteraceae bacterium]